MIYILPIGSTESEGLPVGIVGSLSQRLSGMLSQSPEEDTVVEMDSDEYSIVRDALLACDVEFKVVTGVPDIDSPRSFLYELDGDRVIVYSSLSLKEDNPEEAFMRRALGSSDEEHSRDEG